MARYSGNKECFRIILWMSWVTTVLLTTIYYILNMVVFWKLLQASSELNLSLSQIQGGAAKIWRAPMAACLLGSLLVFGFNLFSCIVLLKKSINRSGPGYGYGFLTAFCFTLAWFTLLCALVLDGFREVVSTNLVQLSSWSKYSTDVYTGAEVFCFVAFAIFIIFFLVLVILQGAVSDQLGIGAEYSPYTRMGDMPVPQALKGPAPGGLPAAPEDSQYDAYNTYGNDANYGNYYQQPPQQGQEAQQGEYQPGEYVATQEYSPQDNYDYNQYNQQYGNSTQYNAYGQDEATQPLAQPIAPPPYEGYSSAPYHPGAAQSARI